MSRSLGGTSLTTRSPIVTVPALMSSSPATILRAVDLPQPDGPTSTMNSPSVMFRLKSLTAFAPPGYTLSTWSMTMRAIRRLPCGRLSLHRARRQPGNDPALEGDDEDDDWNGHDHGRRGPRADRL